MKILSTNGGFTDKDFIRKLHFHIKRDITLVDIRNTTSDYASERKKRVHITKEISLTKDFTYKVGFIYEWRFNLQKET